MTSADPDLFKERELKFKQYEQTYLGTKEDIESQIRRDTENEIEAMKKNVAAHKQQVCRMGVRLQWGSIH